MMASKGQRMPKGPGNKGPMVGPKSKNPGKTLKRLMSYVLNGYKMQFIIVIACIIISALVSVAGNLFLGTLIDEYIIPLTKTQNPDFAPLLSMILKMAVIFYFGAISTYAYNRIMIFVSI